MRTAAGWRAYGPAEMERATRIVALRSLGLSLAQVARVLKGEPDGLSAALTAHLRTLENETRELTGQIAGVRRMLAEIDHGQAPGLDELVHLMRPGKKPAIVVELAWPWGGERFELRDIRALTFIVGPLFSGKTRLARLIAAVLPDCVFIGLDRTADGAATAGLPARVDRTVAWLVEDGASATAALVALVTALEAHADKALVIDMVEHGLDQASQEAVIAHLRRRDPDSPPVFLLTRSTAILDLKAVGLDESILFCPANHSPPILVAPHPGAAGYESVASCLASPEVRARSDGVVAMRVAPG